MFTKFSSISQFREVRRNVEWDTQYRGMDEEGHPIMDRTATLPTLSYTGTVKCHGTNAAIGYADGEFWCQSREHTITPENDNAGFARWVSELPTSVHDTLRAIYGHDAVVFGEWCGGNIQKGVAISGLPKMFVIFAVRSPAENENDEPWQDLICEPSLNTHGIYTSHQFGVWNIDIDFENPKTAIEKMNALTLTIEAECPVGKFFGKSGIGEGLVFLPDAYNKKRSRLTFKVKGSKHSQSKIKKLAAVDCEKVAGARAFAEKHVHNERLEQAYAWLGEMSRPQHEKSTGLFIKRVVDDVAKEESDELAFNGLTDKDVNGIISSIARKWFFTKLNK